MANAFIADAVKLFSANTSKLMGSLPRPVMICWLRWNRVTLPGAFAEYCAYPAGKVFKIKNLSDVEATLLEPASCAAHGLDKIAPK